MTIKKVRKCDQAYDIKPTEENLKLVKKHEAGIPLTLDEQSKLFTFPGTTKHPSKALLENDFYKAKLKILKELKKLGINSLDDIINTKRA